MGNKFGWHSGVLTCKDVKVQGDLYVQDDIIFSDVSAGTLGVTGGIDMTGTTSAIGIDMSGGTFSTGAIRIGDDVKLIFGAGNDASFEFDENGTDHLRYDGLDMVFDTATKLLFRDSALSINSSADGQLDIAADVTFSVVAPAIKLDGTITLDDDGTIADAANVMTLTQNTITLAGSTSINLDGPTTISGAIVMDAATTTGISLTGAMTDGLVISGTCSDNGIEISGACTGSAIEIVTGAFGIGLNVNADGTTGIAVANTFSGTTMLALAGTGTDGINISGICGDAIEISAAATTTGLNISADCVTGITIGAQTTAGISIANTGIGILMTGTYNNALRITNTLATSAQTTVRVLDTYTAADGYHTAVMGATIYNPSAASGYGAAIGVYGEANIQGDFTGGTNWSFGVRGTLQLTNDTVLNSGSSIFGAINASMKDDATPTLTAGHVCGIYIENLIDANLAAMTGISSLIYAANNSSATCTLDYGMYLYGPKVTNLLGLYDCTVSGCVAANAGTAPAGDGVIIKIDVDGTPLYIKAASAWT